MELARKEKCNHCECDTCQKNINRKIWDCAAGACDGCSFCEEMPDGECIVRKNVDIPRGRM